MKAFYYRDPDGNFGDDLNLWMWQRLFPKPLVACFDHDTLFLGIGTILDDQIPATPPKKLIFGSGVGYGPLPKIDARWHFYGVRGPRTAAALGLPAKAAISDGALLVHEMVKAAARPMYDVSYMPHHRTAKQGDWRGLCESLSIHYLDPTAAVETTLEGIRQSALVISEAMHGAIIADALRIPWISVRTSSHILEFKWQDWSESLGMEHRFEMLPAIETVRTTIESSNATPDLNKNTELRDRLRSLSRKGSKRLSPEKTFERVHRRMRRTLDVLIAAA